MRISTSLTVMLTSLLAGICAHAQDVVSTDEAIKRFGMDLDTAEIRVETIAPGLHAFFGAGGNLVVSIGRQGVLLVDDQLPAMVPRIEAAIRQLGGAGVDFVVNTHWHFDHAGGNLVLSENGAWIISQTNSHRMLLEDQRINLVSMVVDQPAYPADALPVVTYDDRMSFHFNEETIDLLHFGSAHTTGDTAVVFRGRKAVHMGDVFNSRYPFIDADSGGTIDGVIRFCEGVLNEIDDEFKVIPGHGVVSSYADLAEYTAMLKTIRDRIVKLIRDGATLEEIIAANPTSEWDEKRGNPALLLNRAYAGLSTARD